LYYPSTKKVSIGFDKATRKLEVEFKSQQDVRVVYQYDDVSESTYDALMSAESHGKYMSEHIKGNYSYNKI